MTSTENKADGTEELENEKNNVTNPGYTKGESEFADGKGSQLDEETHTPEESGESGDPADEDADFESPKDDPA
ncbi:MAG: hypothetical protein EOO92_12160 [Pedobacter sp.]|nr:MAG: hypothetical protein EOO92_12160 [Pedobacter sp.]